MTDARYELASFLADHLGEQVSLPSDADLLGHFGIEGDDAFALMDDFGHRFDVDMTGYRWFFHHGEEGHNVGGIVFRPPYRRVKRIPLSLDILLEAIGTRRWPIQYPAHRLPKVRWDMWLNVALFIALPGALVLLWLWTRFVR